MDEDERRRKVEVGRAKKSSKVPREKSLASFRQKRAKSNGARPAKKAAPRAGPAVSQDDGATQDRHLAPPPPTTTDRQEPERNSVLENAPATEKTTLGRREAELLGGETDESPVGQMRDGERLVLISQEQLQQAVEKRDEIIGKLSGNLQEALASRDELQLEVQSLAGQIQALQKKLQQTGVDFQRLKSQLGPEVHHAVERRRGTVSQNEDLGSEDASVASQSGLLEDAGKDGETRKEALKERLEEEEEERLSREESLRTLKREHQEELDRVKRLLEESAKEVSALKAFKELQNQDQAASEKTLKDNDYLSLAGDLVMERYLAPSSWSPGRSCATLDTSSEQRFELDSDVFSDQALLSISKCVPRETWDDTVFEPAETSGVSGRFFAETDLARELLNQQCEELRQELLMKDHDLEAMREEIRKTAEDLEEARSRWAQVTEELMDANREVEDEKERRRWAEEKLNLQSLAQDSLQEEKMASEASPTVSTLDDKTYEESDTSSPPCQNGPERPQMQAVDDNCLETLQASYDELLSELEEIKNKYQTTSAFLDERTTAMERTEEELQTTRVQLLSFQTQVTSLKEELENWHCRSQSADDLRRELESEIRNLEGEKAQALREREIYRSQQEKMEQLLKEELDQFENLIKIKDAEFAGEREKWEDERQEKDKQVGEILQTLKTEREEEVKALTEKWLSVVEEATESLRQELHDQHRREISELNSHAETELRRQIAAMEQEQKRQMSLIKQVTEREHERAVSELLEKQQKELRRLKLEVSAEVTESLEAAHQVEMEQAQAQKARELEAFHMSLTNLHTSPLEVTQDLDLTNVQVSLRDQPQLELDLIRMQNEAKELRLRQSHQRDMEELKESFAYEKGSMEEKQTKEINLLRSEWASEAERTQSALRDSQASLAQTSRDLTEANESLSRTRTELQESKARLESLEILSQEQKQKLQEELKRAWADRNINACSLENLVSSHKALLQEKEQQVQQLEETRRKLQEEMSRLREEQDLLKKTSKQEVDQLWAQLESMRTSRQELGELKEQLLARSSRVDDMERLKVEFNKQKREIEEQNEVELEGLRRYFEQRLRVSEESYREEIALLQMKLVESALEDSLLKSTEHSFISQDPAKGETEDVLWDDSLQMDQQKEGPDTPSEAKYRTEINDLQSSFKEELQKVHSDLAAHYYRELQEMKSRHSLEVEQLRAKLSERHLREVTRVHTEAARQVEVEVELRLWGCTEERHTSLTLIHSLQNTLADEKKRNGELSAATRTLKREHDEERLVLRETLVQQSEEKMRRAREEHHAELAAVKKEMEEEKARLEKALSEEKAKKAEYPQTLKAELQHETSTTAKEMKELTLLLQRQADERLKQTLDGFEEEKAVLEQRLAQKNEMSLAELQKKHQTQLEKELATLVEKHSKEVDSLQAQHKAQLECIGAGHDERLASAVARLRSEHKAQISALASKRQEDLEALEASYRGTVGARLEAREAELAQKHQEEVDEIEKRMLSNMDTLEATYLKEVHALRDEMILLEQKHHQDLVSQKERYFKEQEVVREEVKKELAQMHVDKFRAMAAELDLNHQTELAAQKESLDAEHCKALSTLKAQVLELEQQHGTALQELTQAFTTDNEQLRNQFQLQLKELKGVSARELEACRRELDEESCRKRQHYLEEAELLKAQLQIDIQHVKTEKEAELEDLRQALTSEQEEKENSYNAKMSQLQAQLQQLEDTIAQLRAEVGCLKGKLEGEQSEKETLDVLLQRRERENQEGGNHLKMLTDDLLVAKEERRKLYQDNDTLKNVVIEMLRSTIATEELIDQKINTRSSLSGEGNKNAQESALSVADITSTDDMELTPQLCESLLVLDAQLHPGGEETAVNACSRLRHTVDTLLDLLNQANAQLQQMHNSRLSMEERFSQSQKDSVQLLEQHDLLSAQIEREVKSKAELELELHKTAGLLDGYVAEKAILEEALVQKETQEEHLVKELDDLRRRAQRSEGLCAELENLRARQRELGEENAALLRQKEHLSAGLGEREKGLLAETERLTQDRLDMQRQAAKDQSALSQRLQVLERELEEQETKGQEKEHHHKNQAEDLNQQVQALEKQLKNNRQFIEEQAVEREHERDEFQQEIGRLENQLRQTSGGDVKGHRFEDLVLQMENMEAIITRNSKDQASWEADNQEWQRELAERNEEIDKMSARIRELEQALLCSAESNGAAEQLEQQLHRAKLREEELMQDKQALEQQQMSNRLQISALQSKVDETRHCYNDNAGEPTQELRDALDAAQQSLQSKEQEVDVLLGQLDDVQRDLSIKDAEVKYLTVQLERISSEKTTQVNQLQEQIDALKEQVSTLSILAEEKEVQRQAKKREEETLPTALLQEKNQEIDHLNNEIQRLEQELDNTNNKVCQKEVEAEHLLSDNARLRQDKREEQERLHEVISTLQAELSTLRPNVCEVSDSQDGDSINPSPAPSPEPGGGPSSLKHELHLSPSRPLRSRLRALRSRLETAAAEKEALERLLLAQEQEFGGQNRELARRLDAERDEAERLRGRLAGAEEERAALRVEKDHLGSLVARLGEKERDLAGEVEDLKSRELEWRSEGPNLEARAVRLQAEVAVRDRAVEEERAKSRALESATAELSAKSEALAKREVLLLQEIERLKARAEELTAQILEKQSGPEEEVMTRAGKNPLEADAAVKSGKTEPLGLAEEPRDLREELAAVKLNLNGSIQRAEKLLEDGQSKERALVELENDNRLLKEEIVRLRGDLNVQQKSRAAQRRQLDTLAHHNGDVSQICFEDAVSASLSSPEVMRHMECSRDLLQEHLYPSILGFRLSELSTLELVHSDPGLDKSPTLAMEPPLSRTITPALTRQSSHSPRSLSLPSDNSSIADSAGGQKMCDLEGLDLTAPPSSLGSTSSLSVAEWASDGYGSNVSSELGARLKVELEQTERLDAQFMEYLGRRGVKPVANTDSAAGSMSYSDDLLTPELQAHLRKVYQESCRILTLSQRWASTPFNPSHVAELNSISHLQEKEGPALLGQGDQTSSNPPMGWQEEKRALQGTVISLRELLCRMAQRHTQTNSGGDADREFLQAEFQTKAELEEAQKQLKCAHQTRQEQKNKIQALGLTIEEYENTLGKERTLVKELQQQLENERVLNLQQGREVEEKLEATRVSSEELRSEILALRGLAEQERVTCSNLRRELQIEQSRSVLLEKRLEEERRRCSDRGQESARLEGVLTQSEARLAEVRSRLADAHRALDEERGRRSEQLRDAGLARQADAARDAEFVSELRSRLEAERRRAEGLALAADVLRAELAEGGTREEASREQKRKTEEILEARNAELGEVQEGMRLLKERWDAERHQAWQEHVEKDKRHERTVNKLRELELLGQQERQRAEDFQRTLAQLQRKKGDPDAQSMDGAYPAGENWQMAPTTSTGLLEKMLKENTELTQSLTSLSREKSTLNQKVTRLERQLLLAENEAAKVTTERENIPLRDVIPSNKVQRLYERYLRAESFRKALVYQKRYLLLLLGGFKDCERATLCMIATMGVRPTPAPSSRRPLGRFRSAARVVVAVSRMKFLTRKWQKAIRRSPACGSANSYATGGASSKAEVLREQKQPCFNFVSPLKTDAVSATFPPGKSTVRTHNSSTPSSQETEKSLTEFIHHLEKVQQRLVGSKPGPSVQRDAKKFEN
ncbi:pericentrin [Stigmatopora argus]